VLKNCSFADLIVRLTIVFLLNLFFRLKSKEKKSIYQGKSQGLMQLEIVIKGKQCRHKAVFLF
jgi:hypothetical protein